MLDAESRLPRVGFGVVAPFLEVAHAPRIKRLGPISMLEARAQEELLGVEKVAIVFRALAQ